MLYTHFDCAHDFSIGFRGHMGEIGASKHILLLSDSKPGKKIAYDVWTLWFYIIVRGFRG